MAAPVALIQGASRGLGLEFCKHILKKKSPAAVLATCRNPDAAAELRGLAGQHPGRLTVFKLDVNLEEDVRAAAERVKENFGRLDLLVNSSAMLHPSGRGETSLRDVTAQGVISTLTTNTVGPLVMARYFAPLLQNGSGGFGQQPAEKTKQHSGIIVNITAKVGSIGDNGLGGWYSYRMSKAALNMATRNISIELGRSRPKVVCVSLHPGTVNTDLSRPYQKNVPKDKLFSTEHSGRSGAADSALYRQESASEHEHDQELVVDFRIRKTDVQGGPAMDLRPVQGVPRLSHSDCWR